jgi:hypothetical protein
MKKKKEGVKKVRVSFYLPEPTIEILRQMSEALTLTDRGMSRVLDGAIKFACDNKPMFIESLTKKD